MTSIRWQVSLPATTGPRARPKRLLSIVISPNRDAALKLARARHGRYAEVQAVLDEEAEADDLSALRRTRPNPPTDKAEKPCLKCGGSRGNGARYCLQCCPKEVRVKRAYKKREWRSRQRKRPCKRPGCPVEVTEQSRTGYCAKCAAFMRYRQHGAAA